MAAFGHVPLVGERNLLDCIRGPEVIQGRYRALPQGNFTGTMMDDIRFGLAARSNRQAIDTGCLSGVHLDDVLAA
jgi:hypothetical protein